MPSCYNFPSTAWSFAWVHTKISSPFQWPCSAQDFRGGSWAAASQQLDKAVEPSTRRVNPVLSSLLQPRAGTCLSPLKIRLYLPKQFQGSDGQEMKLKGPRHCPWGQTPLQGCTCTPGASPVHQPHQQPGAVCAPVPQADRRGKKKPKKPLPETIHLKL